ncbi:MAG: NADH-quinone oxidoreductase subunit J [Candidatus Eremiobacteraeota bacterium]|nr:NADH-quinone oxidoreductase subunit J [Candidatus Eremiobacteraeota bacterium]MBV8203439.1 NADH-quinone oxidoreductase subunit J [Candidatus Eremiobacteraeota bacterium]MBV8262256.1 NADH-quinone oxidoreductase subunit J [Candidatus Eremiobacteraeota bacterium]MBV8340675.1 NADH-quinone oxidoreductase subunit J [Candidatus Eremiobacteraeota bacterium]MBV8460351.1 NADH-quinone oxidoreductase subunit J [Candidatus Eremiobacteraeota bacterium]
MMALFWICTAILILTAIGVVASRHPVHSVIALIVNFSALAVMFLMLNAEFLAMIQIIIYAGAILVLFLFVITLLTIGTGPVESGPSRLAFQAVPSIVSGIVALALLASGVRTASAAAPPEAPADFGLVGSFGMQLLTTHLFAFEVTGFVLLIAVLGVVLMAARKELRF